jgi:hypothetical protein
MKAAFMRGTMLCLVLALAGCTTTGTYPTEATRFHAGVPILRGPIDVEPFDVPGGRGPDYPAYAQAVAGQLNRLGWATARTAGPADQVAYVGVEHSSYEGYRQSPVSVGVGGATGGWHSGVGMGLGFGLGGGPRHLMATTLNVRIVRRTDRSTLWEGRSTAIVRDNAPEAATPALAQRLAEALFRDFPGVSGRTIRVP